MRCEEMNTRKEGEEMDKKENKGIILFPEFEKIKEEVEKNPRRTIHAAFRAR